MSENQHCVYFEGEIEDGFSIGQVKKNLVKLFKSDADRISRLFSGERVVLKKNIDLATAEKYHSVLLNAGAHVSIGAANDNNAPTTTHPPTEKKQPEFSWSLAPIGSLLLRATEKVKQAVVNVDISHLSLASVFAVEKKQQTTVETSAPDTSHLTVAPVGEKLVESARSAVDEELALDLTAYSIDPPGTRLGTGSREVVQDVQFDLSEYMLLEPGEETAVSRAPQSAAPAAPDVSHLELLPQPEPEEEDSA